MLRHWRTCFAFSRPNLGLCLWVSRPFNQIYAPYLFYYDEDYIYHNPYVLRHRRSYLSYYCMSLTQVPPPAVFICLQPRSYVTYSLSMALLFNYHARSVIGALALHCTGLAWSFACGLATLSINLYPFVLRHNILIGPLFSDWLLS